jgi:outer membrane protein assembly factor BamA
VEALAAEAQGSVLRLLDRVEKQRKFMSVKVMTRFGSRILLLTFCCLFPLDGIAQLRGPKVIERVVVIGYRRLTERDIRAHIRMRPGQLFMSELGRRDLDRILATGLFDTKQTRVFGETGVRGGVEVVFEMVEMPLISKVTFKDLSPSEEIDIVELLRAKRIDLVKDAVYQPGKAQSAQRLIKELLISNGWRDVRVTDVLERIDTFVSIEFAISRSK